MFAVREDKKKAITYYWVDFSINILNGQKSIIKFKFSMYVILTLNKIIILQKVTQQIFFPCIAIFFIKFFHNTIYLKNSICYDLAHDIHFQKIKPHYKSPHAKCIQTHIIINSQF